MAADLTWLDAVAQAELVATGQASPRELVEAAIARIEKVNPVLNAVVAPQFEKARAQASAELPRGPFRGVPFLLKDLICGSQGDPLCSGSRLMKAIGMAPPIDTNLARRYREAGLVFLGKTATPEFGLTATSEALVYGPTRNPWDVARSPGGSSGGSAAAVASGMVPAAHANDGGGSIRIPASACGIVGLKTSRGRISLGPLAGEGWNGLAGEHVVSRSVRDSAALLDATAGAGSGDPYAAPPAAGPFLREVGANPGSLRIAYTSSAPNGAPVDAESLRALAETVRLCADLGHRVERADPAIDGSAVVPTFLTIAAANTVVNLASHPTAGRPPRADEVERVTWGTARMGDRVTGADYVRAIHAAHRLGRQMAEFHERWDVLLTPGLATLPAKLGWIDMMMEDVDEYWRRVFTFSPFTVWFNLTGQPAMMLPLARSESGMPVAVQLVARHGDEGTLFRLAAQLEKARPWFDRQPSLAA